MTSPRLDVRPDLLTWAIARAGKAVDEFLEVNPNVAKWIAGEKKPTLKQLEGFAKKVYVPFGMLLLNQPPVETDPLPLFRTINQHNSTNLPLSVRDTINQVQARQDWLTEFLRQEGEAPLPFINSFDEEQDDPAALAQAMRNTLQLSEGWTMRTDSRNDALGVLTERAVAAGVIVVYKGVVGNDNRRKIPVESCRGFVLVDAYAPFVFINNGDAKAAQLFTLAHELAHLWIGQEGVVDLAYTLHSDDPVERLCNRAAAEFLVPACLFQSAWQTQNGNVPALARTFKVSQIVIARRALDMKLWRRDQFFDFYRQRMATYEKQPGSGGGSFYHTAAKRLSPRFLRYVDSAARSGQLLYSEAYRLTGLNRGTFDKVVENLRE